MDDSTYSKIINAVNQVRYGSIDITIHNSKIVQIEIKEKLRFDQSASKNGRWSEKRVEPLS